MSRAGPLRGRHEGRRQLHLTNASSAARAGGSFLHGLVAGAILGLLPVVLQLVGFGAILGRDPGLTTTSAMFGFAGILWGGALGAGIATVMPSGVASAEART